MNRFMVKVNGAEHCPNGICRPDQAADWEGQPVEVIKKNTPREIDTPNRSGVPAIEKGDDVWIWTHEHPDYGHGRGLTAVAKASEIWIEESSLKIRLRDVELIAHPVALADFGRLQSGSRLISRLQASRHPDIYHIDDDSFAEFCEVIDTTKVPNTSEQSEQRLAVIARNQTAITKEIRTQRKNPLALRPVRPGQQAFRDRLMRLYNGRCVVTGCSVARAVEAAHIIPHTGDPELEQPENGLILRRDIHGLFDADLISIDPSTGQIVISNELAASEYEQFTGQVISHQAAPEYLQFRHNIFCEAEEAEILGG